MHVPVWKPDVPRAILLATDLSSRCDRALDRAVMLAQEWNARIVALTVIEPPWGLTSGPASTSGDTGVMAPRLRASQQLRRDIATTGTDVQVEVLVREGAVGPWVETVAAGTGCSLIVTGTARNELLGRILLGSTVDWLARTSKLPVLTVRRRPGGTYSRIVVASDFSASSLHALQVAMALLPDTLPQLFHAFDVPFLGLMDTSRDHAVEQVRAAALAEAHDFLREAGQPALPVVIDHGDPATRLREHALSAGTDVVVVASHGRGALFNLAIGGVAQRILEQAPCDTLLIVEPQARKSG